jgi:hypothetical protein
MRVSVTLDGRNTDAILDTAAPVSVLSMQDAGSMFDLTPGSAGLEEVTSVSGPRAPWWVLAAPFRAASAYTYPFKTLTIGGVIIPKPPIELVQGRNFLGRDYATLLIGNDVLSRFHLYIAYQQRKLYVTETQVP